MFIYHVLLVLFLIFLVFFLSSFTIFGGLILLLIFTCSSLVNIGLIKHKHVNMENINLKVVETHPNYLIVQAGWEKYYLLSHYYINNIQFTINAQLDDILILKGKTEDLQSINNFYEFDFKLFLNANNVNKQIVVKSGKVKIIAGKTLRNIFFNYVNTFPTIIKNWTKLLLFAQQTQENKDIFTTFNNFGITPILVISGLHINFFFMLFKKSLFLIKYELIKLLICFVILFFYLYLLNWSISAMRALMFIFFSSILKFSKKMIHPISILSFSAYCCLCWRPLQFYLLGFQLSFGITFLILFIINKFKNSNSWIRLLLINIVLFLFTLPMQWQINHGFSLLTIPYLLFFTPIIIFYDIILFLNLFLNSIIHIVVVLMLKFLISLIKIINISNVWISTFQIEIWVLQLYFLILIFIYNCWKYFNWKTLTVIMLNFILLSTLWTANNIIKPYYELTMINVGNAMSILVTSPYNNAAILIDAGTEDLKPNNPTIYNYLSAKGIYNLKAVFLTHHDLDHVSNLPFLKKHFKIDKVFENTNQISQYIIDGFNPIHNLVYGFNLQYASENNKSLVLLLQIYNYKILFTGDIEAQTENLLLDAHLLEKINILQVPHHGSKTSSTIGFLKTLSPEVALISGHYQKRKQFPNIETLNNLKKINAQVYYSGKNKTVIIRIYLKHYDIITLT